jgi:hypothetical protein
MDYVARLETMIDDTVDLSEVFSEGDDDAAEVDPDGVDDLVAEVEKYLRDRDN